MEKNRLRRTRANKNSYQQILQDEETELQETVKLRDRDRINKNEVFKDRPGVPESLNKRRRLGRFTAAGRQRLCGGVAAAGADVNLGGEESTDDSFEEDYEAEEMRHNGNSSNHRVNQPSPSTSSLSNNWRNLRMSRSSPVMRVAVDEMIGVPVPRRARSASAKRLHEYSNSGNGGFGDEQSRRTVSPSPASVNGDSASSSSFGVSLKRKMKPVGSKTRISNGSLNSKPSSVTQDDIEIEVAEALFDLMKQSQFHFPSESESSKKQRKPDSKGGNNKDDRSIWSLNESAQKAFHSSDLPRDGLKAEKDEDGGFAVQDGQSIKAELGSNIVDLMELKKEENVEKESNSSNPAKESPPRDGVLNTEPGQLVSQEESESPSGAKVNVDEPVDLTVTKAYSKGEAKRETKFVIDLMATPPMPSSPERDGLFDMGSNPDFTTDANQKSDKVAQHDPKADSVRLEDNKMASVGIKPEPQNFDLDKPYRDHSSVCGSSKPPRPCHEQKNQSQSSSLPIQTAINEWPGGHLHPGFMPPLDSLKPMDGGARSSATFQGPPFLLSQPRPKKCATHQYIARSIRFHLQLMKNSMLAGEADSTGLYGNKTYNFSSMPSSQKMVIQNPLEGDFAGQNLATTSGISVKDKGSVTSATSGASKSKMILHQQAPQVPSLGNLVGPAFTFPAGQQHQAAAFAVGHSGPSKSASAIGGMSSASNPAGIFPVSTSSLPGGAAAVSVNYPSVPANDNPPYIAILQNNGYPFPISTNTGMHPSLKGGMQVPVVPFFNCSFYSSPMGNVSLGQEQVSHSNTMVQSAPQNTSTSSGSPSQKLAGSQSSSNVFLPSTGMQFQQLPKQQLPLSHSSGKSDTEMGRQNGASVTDSQMSQHHKTHNSQSFPFPIQTMNYALMPSGSNGVSNKHGDALQQQGSKDKVELIPSQSFALSFGPNISMPANFSAMVPNAALFQMLPDMVRSGYQVETAAKVTHKNSQMSEGKNAASSVSTDDGRKVMLGKFPTSSAQSLTFSNLGCSDPSASAVTGPSVFDAARTVNFVASPVSGNPFSSSSAMQTSVASLNALGSQQQQHHHQLVQLQKQHMQQMQMAVNAQAKASISNSVPSPVIATNFTNNNLMFSQMSLPTNNTSQPSQWQNLPRTAALEMSSSSPSSSLRNISQQQVRYAQGQTQISFGNTSSAASFQGQQVVASNQPVSSLYMGSPANSSIAENTGTKAGSSTAALPSQQTESSANGVSQKSSPVCGRNVPSILNASSTQLLELKH